MSRLGTRVALAVVAGGTPADAAAHGVEYPQVKLARVVRARSASVFDRLLRGEIGVGKAHRLATVGEPPEAHPAAKMFPMMGKEDRARLKASLEADGYRGHAEPVLVHRDGRIIDGRNRVSVCRDLGIEYPTRVYDGPEDGIVPEVLARNLARRHLNESQRAVVAAKMANLLSGKKKSANLANLLIPDTSQEEAAKALNVSKRSVTAATKVLKRGDKQMIEDVESGKMSVSRASNALGTIKPRKPRTGGKSKQPDVAPPSPPDLRITNPRPQDLCEQFCHTINRLAEIAEKNDPAWMRSVFPAGLVKNLDLSLELALEFLRGMADAHAAKKRADDPASRTVN